MKILSDSVLFQAEKNGKRFLTMFQRLFEHKGRQSNYFLVSRDEVLVPHEIKKSDAVVVVAKWLHPDYDDKLLVTSEFRVPLGVRELGFVAGLIDPEDYSDGATDIEAACRAAVREVKEETGLDLEVTSWSPPNLYSSAGLTNESIIYVFGNVTGTISDAMLQASEDIETLLMSREEAAIVVNKNDPDLAHSKTAWPFIWAFSKNML